jgi:hypothetical protein
MLSKNITISTYEKKCNFACVLYGCETRPLALKDEHRPGVFKNKVLRIFGSKWDEVVGG